MCLGSRLSSVVVLAILGVVSLSAQQSSSEAIPIDHQLTIAKCGGCHQRDANGVMRRISYIRTSPEVWEQIMKRMIRLNGLVLKPEEARDILRYLSANNGLAPEEAKPVFWEAEHRLFRDQTDKIPSEALQHTCNYCHTIGRVLNQRRTRDDYEKLINMHLGLFPGAENTLRPRRPSRLQEAAPVAYSAPTGSNPAVVAAPPPAVSVRTDGRYPADVAIDYLTKAQPLLTPEWTAWKAMMRTPKLEGKWLLTGYQQGKGRVFGTVTIERGTAPDEFVSKTEIEYATSGATLTLTGKGIVYTGYSWRGRSTGSKSAAPPADPGTNPSEWREALFVSRDANTLDGRWFWGGYEEFGIDAHLVRIGSQPLLSGISAYSLQSPSISEIRAYGANFPADLKPGDFDLGTGVSVKRIVKRTPSVAT
ncbi:MAG: quinohemoprotein amine dehydrogenase subunit alpha, partial [Acidobacteriia bacterium]|nr:quinohemoprotein amine dehydrogenase subunit alpha [Terriglobia bacterium]